jgi:hypothetical protein
LSYRYCCGGVVAFWRESTSFFISGSITAEIVSVMPVFSPSNSRVRSPVLITTLSMNGFGRRGVTSSATTTAAAAAAAAAAALEVHARAIRRQHDGYAAADARLRDRTVRRHQRALVASATRGRHHGRLAPAAPPPCRPRRCPAAATARNRVLRRHVIHVHRDGRVVFREEHDLAVGRERRFDICVGFS